MAVTGAERAALVLLALGEQHGAPIWNALDDEEVAAVTQAMTRLGTVPPEVTRAALDMFTGAFATGAGVIGNASTTEQLLAKVLPQDRAAPVLDRLRRPGGPNVWEKLAGLKDQVLADYLAGEYPQTAAVILSRLPSSHAARIVALLPPDFSIACLDRIMKLETVDGAMVRMIEDALGETLIARETQPGRIDPAARIAGIFNALDRDRSGALLDQWRGQDEDAATRVRALMFTFDDVVKLNAAGGQTLVRVIDKDVLALALKGASEPVRAFFLDQMSARAARLFEDQMSQLGPVRKRDVAEAQARIVSQIKELADAGEITLPSADGDEDMFE